MKQIWRVASRRKRRKNESRAPLIVTRSNNTQDGFDQAGAENPSAQTTYNVCENQQHARESPLVEVLDEAPDADATEDGSSFINLPEASSGPQSLISVSKHLPKPAADQDQNLQSYLLSVQETVCNEVVRLGPLLYGQELKGYLIESYHHQIFDHLNDLVETISSPRDSLVLIKWVMHTYLSQELLCHPDLQGMDPIKKVDLLLVTEWVAKAKVKLLDNVQKQVRGSLGKILQIERSQEGCDNEEACVALYVDTIQCIEAAPKEAQKFSSKLSSDIREACFQELLTFLRSYTTEQTEFLGKKAKMGTLETIHFFKTLKACKELKQHIQSKSKDIQTSLLQETEAMLDNLEAFTLKLLKEIIGKLAESHLKNYFKTYNRPCFCIFAVRTHFPKLLWCQDVQKGVMDEAYKLIAHSYLKHLLQSSHRNLTKSWSPNVGQEVAEDAELLHNTISDLAPGVQQWNLLLLRVPEVLDCQSTEAMKLMVAFMHRECLIWSQDAGLLPALLRWKGLTAWQVWEVLDAIPGQRSRPRSWYSFITCL